MTGKATAVRPAVPEDAVAVSELVASHHYSPLRCYRSVGLDIGRDRTRESVERALADPAATAVVAELDGRVAGLLASTPNTFESEHFGVAIDRATELLTALGVDRRDLAETLFTALARELRRKGRELLITSIDGEDLDALGGALRAGHLYCESSVVYVNDTDEGPANLHRPHPFAITCHAPAELASVPDHTFAQLRDQVGRTMRLDHFHADPRLDDERADDLYRVWFDRAIAGEWADLIVVARRDDEVVGLASWKCWDGFKAAPDVRILAQSLAIADGERGRGAGSAITAVACSTRPFGIRFLEYATQTRNLAVNNLVARQFSLNLARTGHVLHLWTDDAG